MASLIGSSLKAGASSGKFGIHITVISDNI
jgi:hypothetical protein